MNLRYGDYIPREVSRRAQSDTAHVPAAFLADLQIGVFFDGTCVHFLKTSDANEPTQHGSCSLDRAVEA